MASAEDSEPLLGPNGESLWAVSPQGEGPDSPSIESVPEPGIQENTSSPQLQLGLAGVLSKESSEVLQGSLSSPHVLDDREGRAGSRAAAEIRVSLSGGEEAPVAVEPAVTPGQVNMAAPSFAVWPMEHLPEEGGTLETATLGMHLSTMSSEFSQASHQLGSQMSTDEDLDMAGEESDKVPSELSSPGHARRSHPAGAPSMSQLLPGAKFSMPKEHSHPDNPILHHSRSPPLNVRFPSGLGASSHGSSRSAGAWFSRSSSAAGKKLGPPPKPPAVGLRWSASIVSTATSTETESSGSEKLRLHVELDDAPVVNIKLQLKEGGKEQYISPSQMPQITVDEELWLGNQSFITEVPQELQHFNFLRTNWTDAYSTSPTYLDIEFHERSRVYILMHSLLPVPDWLEEHFVADEHLVLQVDWRLDLLQNAIAYFGLKYDRMKKSRVKVWRLKKGVVDSGTRLTFRGLGMTNRFQLGFNFIVCWKTSLEDSNILQGSKTRAREKYSSKEQLNAALEDAVVRQDVMKVETLLLQDADVNMTLTISEYRGCLLTKVPAMAHNMPMLCCLVAHGAELDYHGLKYVLEYGHLLPVHHAPVEAFLCKYVRTTRNPANTCYAIAQALSTAAKEHTSKTTEYTALSEKFRRAAINLVEDLNKLSYIGGKERWMLRPDEVLEPTKTYSDHFPINLASCSSTALKMHDTDYSATSTVQNFIQRAWIGVNFMQVARQLNVSHQTYGPGITSNTYFLSLLTHYGFVGPINRALMLPVSQVAHVTLFAGRAFFDSPRGRWAYKVLCHIIFLAVFHLALFEPKGAERQAPASSQNLDPGISAWIPESSNARDSPHSAAYSKLIALFLITIGMIADIGNVCTYQYGGSLLRFLSVESFSTKVDLVQLVVLLASTTLWGIVECMCISSAGCDFDHQMGSLRALKIMFSISAIVVWMQTLFVLRPINRGLAPLLYVIFQMTKEVLVFLVPLSALLIGFAVALFSLFWGEIHEDLGWTSIWSVVLLLFRFFVSDFQMSFDIFDSDRYTTEFTVDPVLQIFGIAVLIFYTILASILMANLLIAILTYKYDPETIDAESNFQRVMIVDDYQNQVDNNLIPSPFSLLVVMSRLLCLPRSSWPKVKEKRFQQFLLPPLDDLSDNRMRPIGAGELPYLIFSITMGPVLNALMIALLVIEAPLCLTQFALMTSKILARKATSAVGSLFSSGPPAGVPSGISFFSRSFRSMKTAFASSRVSNTPARQARSNHKMLKFLSFVAVSLCLLPFTFVIGGAFYSILVLLLVLYTTYVWLAATCYSAFWCIFGLVQGLLQSFKVSGANSSEESFIGDGAPKKSPSQAGPTKKKWGKLLAKQRKEEFKKIAFRPEEIDTALLLAGIPVPDEPEEVEKDSSQKSKPSSVESSLERPRKSSFENDKERLNASIAQGKARMLEDNGRALGPKHLPRASSALNSSGFAINKSNTSLISTPREQRRGLAHGIARFDSRYPDRAGKGTPQAKPFNRAMSRNAHGMGMLANNLAPGGHIGGGLLEASGLMNEMSGVRDDLAQMRLMMETMAEQMRFLQLQMVSRSDGGECDINDTASDADSLIETRESFPANSDNMDNDKNDNITHDDVA